LLPEKKIMPRESSLKRKNMIKEKHLRTPGKKKEQNIKNMGKARSWWFRPIILAIQRSGLGLKASLGK
jgi:hypothetical protein